MERKRSGLFLYFIVGILGIASLYPLAMANIEQLMAELPDDIPLSPEAVVLQSLLFPLILLLVMLFVGYFFADKVRLRSVFVHGGGFTSTRSLTAASAGGIGLGLVILSFDWLFRHAIPDAYLGFTKPSDFLQLFTAILYGGVVEEIIMRWGLMTLLVFLFWKIFQRHRERPHSAIYWIAIIITAFFFSLFHYSANAALGEMTALIWVRMLLLNGIAGLVFGWLFWRRNLESACLAHMICHITMFIGNTILYWFI